MTLSPRSTALEAIALAVRKAIAMRRRLPIDRVVPEASLASDLDVDSLTHISLIMDLERLFDLQLPDAEAANARLVSDLIALIGRHHPMATAEHPAADSPPGDPGDHSRQEPFERPKDLADALDHTTRQHHAAPPAAPRIHPPLEPP